MEGRDQVKSQVSTSLVYFLSAENSTGAGRQEEPGKTEGSIRYFSWRETSNINHGVKSVFASFILF